MTECPHRDNFESLVGVHALSEREGDPVTGWSVDVKIRCKTCGVPFRFIGLLKGVSPYRPMVSLDGDELRAPIAPAPNAVRWEQPDSIGHA